MNQRDVYQHGPVNVALLVVIGYQGGDFAKHLCGKVHDELYVCVGVFTGGNGEGRKKQSSGTNVDGSNLTLQTSNVFNSFGNL